MEPTDHAPIVIAGAGFGGLEAALYLRRRLGDDVPLALVSDRDRFVFRPYLAYVPFGLAADAVEVDLREVAEAHGVRLLRGRVEAVDPAQKMLYVDASAQPYEALFVATGATIGPESVPGLHGEERAFTLWRRADMERLRGAFAGLVRAVEGGARRRVVFLVPPGCRWAGPLYEMAFMLATWLTWQEAREGVELVFLTSEAAFMEALGPDLDAVLAAEFAQRGITGHRAWTAVHVEDGTLIDAEGRATAFDLLVTAPHAIAAATWAPLPADPHGFLRTVPATRQVVGHPDVYAVGDAADYSIKQAFLALLQADAAAEHLAARLLHTAPRFGFDPNSVWMLEQLDQAVLARVVLPEAPEARAAEPSEVERLPVGQLRRMLAGAHLPRHFAANPLYAALFWKGTRVGLKVLDRLRA
ncbi:MAG: FAD-dependent oxidoreductase [Rhodothermales bacterium]|nr:FAD-dependent oxidoreductase [Rhodothermales bacterium]